MEHDEIRRLPVDKSLTIIVSSEMPHALANRDIQAIVDKHWQNQQEKGVHLFDGWIFNVTEIKQQALHGSFIPYRYYTAWRNLRELRSKFNLKPLSMSAITVADDYVLVGKRSDTMSQYPGHYEFAPSGGVDKENVENGKIDFYALALRELQEETGISSFYVKNTTLIALVENAQEGLLELCIHIDLTEKPLDTVSSSFEYTKLIWIEKTKIEKLFKEYPDDWVPFSKALWSLYHSQTKNL